MAPSCLGRQHKPDYGASSRVSVCSSQSRCRQGLALPSVPLAPGAEYFPAFSFSGALIYKHLLCCTPFVCEEGGKVRSLLGARPHCSDGSLLGQEVLSKLVCIVVPFWGQGVPQSKDGLAFLPTPYCIQSGGFLLWLASSILLSLPLPFLGPCVS